MDSGAEWWRLKCCAAQFSIWKWNREPTANKGVKVREEISVNQAPFASRGGAPTDPHHCPHFFEWSGQCIYSALGLFRWSAPIWKARTFPGPFNEKAARLLAWIAFCVSWVVPAPTHGVSCFRIWRAVGFRKRSFSFSLINYWSWTVWRHWRGSFGVRCATQPKHGIQAFFLSRISLRQGCEEYTLISPLALVL